MSEMTPYTMCRALADRLGMADPTPRELFDAVVGYLPGAAMPAERPKPPPPIDVEAVVDALIRRRLDRGLLLSWLPDGVRGALPEHRTAASQYRSDVLALCETPEHLGAYLRQAARLASPFAEAPVFSREAERLQRTPRTPTDTAGHGRQPRPLTDDEISRLCDLAMGGSLRGAEPAVALLVKWSLEADEPGRWRAALRASLPLGFVFSLPGSSRPVDQVRFVMMELGRTPRLIGLAGRPMDLAIRAFADMIPAGDRGQFADDVRRILGDGR